MVFGLIDVGGLSGCSSPWPSRSFSSWANTGSTDNPFAVQWFYIVFGLGLVQSFGYWCTDFLVVQRALAAGLARRPERTPLIAAFPKLMYGVLAIFPGLIALSILPNVTANVQPTMLPLRDGPLLPHRDARAWPDGAARGLHERDGRQRDGL